MTWNLLHLAWMINDAGGIPVHGNQRAAWDAGCRFDHPNPEYRLVPSTQESCPESPSLQAIITVCYTAYRKGGCG